MSSHTRRAISPGSLNVSLFLALLLAGFASLSLTRQTRAVDAPNSKTEKTFALGPAASATPIPLCETSRWSAEGNTNDSSGPNSGTPTSLKNGATFGPGATGQAFNLDGLPGKTGLPNVTGDYVAVPINTTAMNQPGSFTWEACVYPLSLKGRVPVVFSKEVVGAGNRAGLQINSNGTLCSYMNSGQCAATPGMGVVVPNKWTRVTLIYNGSIQKLITYVDGVQDSIATVGQAYSHSTPSQAPFNIGWSPNAGGNAHFYGFIDEVTFSTCVLPPTTSPCACGPTPTPTPIP